ncbi:MAG: helix-turn-helix domain-containing protein [Christensenellales bacterium]|jgi:two-component system response regulator YesN
MNYPKQKVAIKGYVRPYLAIFIVPLIATCIIYAFAMSKVSAQSLSLLLAAQENTVAAIDASIGRINETALSMMLDGEINTLSHVDAKEMNTRDILYMITARKRVGFYVSNHVFQDSFSIIYPQNEIVCTDAEVIAKLRFWYENFFSFEGYTYEDWLAMMKDVDEKKTLPMQDVVNKGRAIRAMPYLVPLLKNDGENESLVVFLMEESQLRSHFARHDDSQASDYIFDRDGTLLYQTGLPLPEKTLGWIGANDSGSGASSQEGFIAVYVKSPMNGWTYASAIPINEALGEVNDLKNLMIVLAAIALLAGLALIWHSSRRTAYPIEAALSLLKSYDHKLWPKNDYGPKSLEAGVKTLITSNKDQAKRLSGQDEQLRALYMERILTGSLAEDTEGLTGMSGSFEGLASPEAKLLTVLFKFQGAQDSRSKLLSYQMQCAELLENIEDEGIVWLTHILKQDELVLIIANKHGDVAKLKKHVQMLLEWLNKVSPVEDLRIGVGSVCGCLKEIQQSYRQAKYALSYMTAQSLGSNVCWAEDIPTNMSRFVFTQSTEMALVNAIRKGEEARAAEILEQIYYDNFVANSIPSQMQRCLIYDVYCTYVRCAPMRILDDNHIGLDFLRHAEELTFDYAQAFKVLAQIIIIETESCKPQADNSRISKVLDYIHQRYNDCSLDVPRIAEKFGLSDNYFSQYFKEQVGERFGEYLEKYRILQANLLLARQDMSVYDISQEVGYANVYTFRRAFKRVMGVAPTEYQKGV